MVFKRKLTVLQESKVPSLPELRSLLQSRADPNHRYEEEFELHNVKWNDGCPLQFGVTSGDRTIVQLLLQYNGDIHRSSYSKKAGASGQLWVGNAPFAALPADNVDMLQLLVESHSVSPDLGSTVGGKPGAKMLWNSSYFGALKCTRYLLEARAAVDETAPWQDNTALNYTPLHVAARAGNEKCCELLLQFSADMKGKCHVKITEQEGYILKGDWYFTPLDTAIEMSQISVVKLLLQKKADLISGKDVHCLTSAKDKHLRVDRRNYSLQSLLRSGNSRVISEVARSLQDRWQQMTLLTVQDIVRFLETPGDAPVELMKALFHEHSQIKYWLTAAKSARGCKGNGDKYDTYFRPEYIMAVKQSPTRVYAQSANIRKMLVYGQVQYVINFTEGPSNEDVEKHWKNRSYMEDQIPRFVDRLAPQPTKDRPLSQRLREQVMGECTYLPVNFFACLVPNMHRSEEVLLAIADCPNQEIFRLRECEAIVSFNWTTVQLTQLVDLGIQAVTSLMVLLSISTFRDEAADWCNKLPVFAGIGLPLVILTLLMRIGEVIGNQLHKAWDVYSEVALHLATLALFIVFLSSGEVSCQSRGIIDNLWMRSAIILVSSLRLLTCCDMMRLALSEVNMIVTPILSALMKSLPWDSPDASGQGFRLVLVLVPSGAVIAAVSRQSKVVAAFAQLNDLQERADRQTALASQAVEVDKQWFIIGVSNLMLSAYILGAFPNLYYLFFTPKVLSLILLRLVKFYRKKQHFLLWDFCYWANFLCIFYCWVTPKSPAVFRTVFLCANGPLAWSVLAFNHAMIFHSYAHMTSVVVHVSPLLLSYGIRWYGAPMTEHELGAKHFRVCDSDAESCLEVSSVSLVGGALLGFYLWWMVLYYVWIFGALGSYIEKNSYQTLWDRILVMKPVGPFLQKLLKRWPKLLVQLVYLILHLLFSTGTMCVAVVLWHSQLAHFMFLCAIGMSTIKNAAEFYFDVISSKYEEAAGNSKVPVSKKILAASGALGFSGARKRKADMLQGHVKNQFCGFPLGFAGSQIRGEAFILWQAYWTLDVEEWQNGWKAEGAIIIAWRFAVLGDFEVEELEGQEGTWHQEDDGSGGIMLTYEDPQLTTNSTVVRGVFIVLCGMMFPVLIMNILISVLSVWLSFALKNVWLDFQQARARRVLRYKAMTRIWSCKRRHQDTDLTDSNAEPSSTRSLNLNKLNNGGSPGYIWFSAPKEEEILQDDIDPGLNLKFKEATEGANRIESRLTNLERNVQLLVDTTAKNEKRRAKQTFEKAFTGARDA
ncbi:unnamed protein product [Effrenium voratum]|nr:unnamed protein product [Effrenium voratum]